MPADAEPGRIGHVDTMKDMRRLRVECSKPEVYECESVALEWRHGALAWLMQKSIDLVKASQH